MDAEENQKQFPSAPTALGNRKLRDSHIPTAATKQWKSGKPKAGFPLSHCLRFAFDDQFRKEAGGGASLLLQAHCRLEYALEGGGRSSLRSGQVRACPDGTLAGPRITMARSSLELVEIELGVGPAQLNVLDVLGVALLPAFNRGRVVLLAGVLDLYGRGYTLVSFHVGEDGVGPIHLQRVIARRQLLRCPP